MILIFELIIVIHHILLFNCILRKLIAFMATRLTVISPADTEAAFGSP